MSKIIRIGYLGVILVIYIILFNLVSSFDFLLLDQTISLNPSNSKGSMERAAFGDKVEVSIFRDRFFWDIKTSYKDDHKNSKIYFFGVLPLPLTIYDINIFYVHIVTAVVFSFLILKVMFSNERRYYE